ncbi:MAG TPA: FHA domain-containing protein [Anaerolineales bacterium]|nr:FHA domain-containing protein [Anaerolineales bacterium]
MTENDDKPTAPFDNGEASPPDGDEAFLIVNGVDLFPINQAVISIGRRIDNALVLNDPRVSRAHAEIRCYHGRFVVFDLGSSGGTYLNGQRVTHSVVYDGDIISLAGVHLIFRQKNLPRPDLNKTATF